MLHTRVLLTFWLLLCTAMAQAQKPHYSSLTMEDGLQDNSVSAILMDRDGFVFLGSPSGVDRFDGTYVVNIPYPGTTHDETERTTALAEEDAGHIVVGSTVGLWRLDKRQLTLSRIFKEQIDAAVTGIQRTRNGGLTISTPYGTFLLRQGKLTRTGNREKGLTRFPANVCYGGWGRFDNAYAAYKDGRGGLWAGYKFFGVDYTWYNRGLFHVFAIPGVFSSQGMQVRSFLRDGTRTLVGTRKGLYVVDGSRVTLISSKMLGADIVTAIVRYGNEYYAATLGGGMAVISAATLHVSRNLMRGANVYMMADDHKGALWLCSSKGLGCYDLKNGRLRVMDCRNSQLPSDEVFCIGFDVHGNGWLSTADGPCRYLHRTGYLSATDVPRAMKALGALRSVEPQPNGTLLLLPQQGAPAYYDPQRNVMRREITGNGQEKGQYLFYRTLGNGATLFVNNGIGLKRGRRTRMFGYLDGLPSHQIQSHAVLVDGRGFLWAATNGGLVYARISELLNRHYKPLHIIPHEIQTDHWWDAQEVNQAVYDQRIRLSRYNGSLTVKFTPMVYGNTRDLKYRYRLAGSDDSTWHEANHDHVISYRKIHAGNYTLQVEAIGMPELHGDISVDAPFTYGELACFALACFITIATAYVLWCRKTKRPYFWKAWMPKPQKYTHSAMSAAEARSLQRQLQEYLDKEKPYLNANLQMSDLAKALGCTTHELSQVFSQYMHRSYYDLMAECRVKAFMRMADDPQYAKYTITALSELCGFKSRTPFLVAFKKFTGTTPKDYMKTKTGKV